MKTLLVLVTLGLFSSLSFAAENESESQAMARLGLDKYPSHVGIDCNGDKVINEDGVVGKGKTATALGN